jgi:hypothetical protein
LVEESGGGKGVGGGSMFVGCSMGVSFRPNLGRSATTSLIRKAAIA